jgi:starch synthase
VLIAFATPEVFPYSKTGGLADVSSALPRALADLGHEVIVFSPYYRQVRDYFERHSGSRLQPDNAGSVWIGDDSRELEYLVSRQGSLTQVFTVNDHYFDRANLYTASDGKDYLDNVSRFSFFCRAILAYLAQHDLRPPVIHCNDWQAALIPLHISQAAPNTRFSATRTVMTIHNLGYQGVFPAEQIYATGLDWDRFTIDELEFYGKLNLLKGGIAAADAVTTVSPTYSTEIQTAEYGFGLGGFLLHHKGKLSGILNGIDAATWNPETDHYLPDRFAADDMSGKAVCKARLQDEAGFEPDPQVFLMGVVSRLDRQKGMHLIAEAFPRLAGDSVQLVVLGSGAGEIEQMLAKLAGKFPQQVAFINKYDESMAHLVEAGADAFLMPSAYEPCGLNQLYSQRYGTVPIVRETGGLKDTVTNYTPTRLKKGLATGFSFRKFDGPSLLRAIRAAYKLYTSSPADWQQLVQTIMALDHGWDARAREYEKLYGKLAAAGSRGSHKDA